MIYHSQNVVVILTTDWNTRKLFRDISSKFPNCIFNISPCTSELKNDNGIKVIFLEKKYSQTDVACLKIIESVGKKISKNIPIVLITQECSFENLKHYLSNGIESVIYKPVNKSLLESLIFKYTLQLKDTEVFNQYHGIKLYPNLKIAYYNDCKIFLSDIETSLLSILMPKENEITFFSLKTLKELLNEKLMFTISDTYLRVTISRLRSKFERVSGLNIIKNKYGRGYYISI